MKVNQLTALWRPQTECAEWFRHSPIALTDESEKP